MRSFVNTITIYTNALENIKEELKNGKITQEEAVERATASLNDLKDILFSMDVIYPYKLVKIFENLIDKYEEFISSIKIVTITL